MDLFKSHCDKKNKPLIIFNKKFLYTFLSSYKGINVPTIIPKLSVTALMLALALFAHNAESGILIDNFSDFQAVDNGVDGPRGIIGTELLNVQRTITATASSSSTTTEVVVEGSLLTISNDIASNGTASIYYSFSNINLAAFANALLFTVVSIDRPGNEIQMIANGTSFFLLPNFGGIGQHSISFSQFSTPLVFTQLESLELKFQGPETWNAQFSSLTTNSKIVPEPSIAILLAIGLIAVGVTRRKDALVKQHPTIIPSYKQVNSTCAQNI
jgi:hypothetical protein